MTVYELIQELAHYDANSEVEIGVSADSYETYAVVDNNEIDVSVNINEETRSFYINEYKRKKDSQTVRINVELGKW